jgi:hypothetical protein
MEIAVKFLSLVPRRTCNVFPSISKEGCMKLMLAVSVLFLVGFSASSDSRENVCRG